MNRLTLMQMPLISSSQVSPSQNHVHHMKLAAVVPPPLVQFKTVNKKSGLQFPVIHLNFFLPNTPANSNTQPENSASVLNQAVAFSITVDTRYLIELQFIIVDFKEQLLDSINVEPCPHRSQVKISVCCLNKTVVDNLMDAVMRNLPSAEFGHIKRA